VRQGYIKDAEDKLKNLSSVDLSLYKNQSEAQRVFQPFYQDGDITSDLVKTKSFQNQFQYADNLRRSKKVEDQARYWDMGVQYIQNGLDSLRIAKRGDGSIQKVDGRRYVDYIDPIKYLNEEAEKAKMIITRETSNGQYKLTRTNGDEAVPLFETWAKSVLSGNNQINDMFRVEGTVLFENKLKDYANKGMDVQAAKNELATEYLKSQASNYKTLYDNLSSYKAKIQSDITAKYAIATNEPTQEHYKELESLYLQRNNTDKLLPSYKKMYDAVSDASSKDYHDIFNSILNRGESFFAEHSRDSLIANWAKGRASNSSVQYDVDPGYKLNIELEKAVATMQNARAIAEERITHTVNGITYDRNGRIVTGAGGNGGTSGSGSAGENKLNQLNTPLATGLNVYGRDPVNAYNRFLSTKEQYLHGYMDTGLAFINQMSFTYASDKMPSVSADYLTALKEQMLTGKKILIKNDPLEQEHKKLQETGVIPKEIGFGEGPMRTYAAIKGYYTDIALQQMKNNSASPEVVQMLDQEERFAEKYNTLHKAEEDEISALKKDPELKGFFNGEKFMTKDEHLKSVFKTTDKNEYFSSLITEDDKRNPNYMVALSLAVDRRFNEETDTWNKKVELFKSKFGKLNISKQDEAYIAPSIRLEAGKKEDQTLAKKVAQVVLGGENFSEQSADKAGLQPVNIDQLTDDDGEKKQINNFLKRVRGDIGSALSAVEITKIGSDGNPTVKLQFDRSVLDSYTKGDDHLISNATANALGDHGIEIAVKDQSLLRALGIDMKFTPATLDFIQLNKNKGVVQASQVLKKAGFDYTIQKDYSGQNLLIKMTYPEFVNGSFKPTSFFRTIPVQGADFDNIRDDLFKTAFKIYGGNHEAYKLYNQQHPQITLKDLQDQAAKYNSKN
jgi:hypothetical protein